MPTDLDAFRSSVLADRALQARLLAEPDRTRFVSLVRELAEEEGLDVSADEVEEALAELCAHHRDRWV